MRRTRFLVVDFFADAFLAVAEEVRLRLAATLEVARLARLTTFFSAAGAVEVAELLAAEDAEVPAPAGADAMGVAGVMGLVPEACAEIAGKPRALAIPAIRMTLVDFFIMNFPFYS